MQSLDAEVIHTALAWLDGGQRVVLGILVRTWGSAPRPVGSLMAIRDDGQVVGSLSGGCIEDDLIGRVQAGDLAGALPQTTLYGATADEAQRFGLPCGGFVKIVLEPLSERSQLREWVTALAEHRLVRRRLDLATGDVQLSEATHGDALVWDEAQLVTVHGPRLRLLLIGGGQLSRCAASMALMLGYQVTVCEPRSEYHEGWVQWSALAPGGTAPQLERDIILRTDMPDDLVLAMCLDAQSAVLALTHDPKLDDLALIEALRTPAFYVGALGSRSNNAARRERLRTQFGLSEAELARLHGPVGLNLGARTPAEIALAALAHLTAVHRGARLDAPLADWRAASAPAGLSATSGPSSTSGGGCAGP